VKWSLRRNCCIAPARLAVVYGLLCLLSLGIGVFFWMQGATMVLPFAFLELLLVGVAFVVYARHATDGESIQIEGVTVVVERECAGRFERAEFERRWVRVEPVRSDGSLIELSGKGQRVQIGRYVRPELRSALAQEIRFALRGA
jgi:uncharacterized membrane protein